MAKIIIDTEKCKGCLLCLEFCPKKCICMDTALNKKGVTPVKAVAGKECIGCAMCAVICPDCCITVYK